MTRPFTHGDIGIFVVEKVASARTLNSRVCRVRRRTRSRRYKVGAMQTNDVRAYARWTDLMDGVAADHIGGSLEGATA